MHLTGGDDRSFGTADQAAALATEPDTFATIWAMLRHDDVTVRMRAADAADKASRVRPDLLQPYKDDLIHPVLEDGTPELSWHLLPMAARLELSDQEAARLMRRLQDAVLNNPNEIVRAEALAAAFSLVARHRRMLPRAGDLAKHAQCCGSPALAARARNLLTTG
jgi:hypothetical protein